MKIDNVYEKTIDDIKKSVSNIKTLLECLPKKTNNWALVSSLTYVETQLEDAEKTLKELL
jgi:hypothetical protein